MRVKVYLGLHLEGSGLRQSLLGFRLRSELVTAVVLSTVFALVQVECVLEVSVGHKDRKLSCEFKPFEP